MHEIKSSLILQARPGRIDRCPCGASQNY
jgi:hypothetical protein